MEFHVISELGPKQALLRSGALLCSDVTIARTGVQYYHPSEIGLAGDSMIRAAEFANLHLTDRAVSARPPCEQLRRHAME